jgi:hypothetical protein
VDPDVAGGIVEGLKAGLPLPTAAARFQVPERTVRRWQARGLASIVACMDADEAGGPIPPEDEPYHSFALRVIEARGSAQSAAVAVVVRAIKADDLGAAQWYLERTDPALWANPAKVDLRVSGDPDAPLVVSPGPPPDVFTAEQRLAEVLAALAEARVPVAQQVIEATATLAD